ncbi:MbtH family protein [Sphaerisporangium sp. TRM90804]|uniref:MbtH family protein n=1 Tax=Sphaerisporangium sp. TRM90804 TaxID=3031113 RepID=UPI002447293F|nr:MbtH family protein [Sphaerisporangium sp. TRM90804]MDH2424452.1 MbtH family protein [Sphaerisporangium sp. TRM90804]
MTNPFEDPSASYVVLVNHEAQYSLWPAEQAVPAGWRPARGPGTRQECLDHVEANWTDMRPLSLRHAAPSSRQDAAPASAGSTDFPSNLAGN